VCFGKRYYDAEIGRWTSTDPGHEFYDLYNYAGGNPIILVDPTGESTKSALTLIAQNRQNILTSAANNKVPAQALASIIFQEKLKGIWADAKNVIAMPKVATNDAGSYSFGISEMQIQTAQRLAGGVSFDEAVALLNNPTTAIDLMGKYVAELQSQIGTNDPNALAQAYNIGAENYNKGKYSTVGLRSVEFQSEISTAVQTGEVVNTNKKEPK